MRTKIDFKNLAAQTRRGDTFIEVMFAIAIFSLVAVLTISMMNLGTANAEGALELTTARHELNAQAEALRYIHSAYTAELALPECGGGLAAGEKCQQYNKVWENLANNALDSSDVGIADTPANRIVNITETLNGGDTGTLDYNGAVGCHRAYQTGVFSSVLGGSSLLSASRAFILNIRDMNFPATEAGTPATVGRLILRATDSIVSTDPLDPDANVKFTPTDLGARTIYYMTDLTGTTHTTDDGLAVHNQYNKISRVEGIWAVAVKGPIIPPATVPAFYDFYIQTCWNPPNQKSPTILDTVIRLYNPKANS